MNGKKYSGTITDIQGGKFKIKYDDFNDETWLASNQFIVIDAATTTHQHTDQQEEPVQTSKQKNSSSLYLGEYASYGYGNGGRLMAGMGFTLMEGGRYYDLDKGRGGTYVYDPGEATISFQSGFLEGQVGKKVTPKGFWLTETVFCEPWK